MEFMALKKSMLDGLSASATFLLRDDNAYTAYKGGPLSWHQRNACCFCDPLYDSKKTRVSLYAPFVMTTTDTLKLKSTRCGRTESTHKLMQPFCGDNKGYPCVQEAPLL